MPEPDAIRPDPLTPPDSAYDLGGLPGGDILFSDSTVANSAPVDPPEVQARAGPVTRRPAAMPSGTTASHGSTRPTGSLPSRVAPPAASPVPEARRRSSAWASAARTGRLRAIGLLVVLLVFLGQAAAALLGSRSAGPVLSPSASAPHVTPTPQAASRRADPLAHRVVLEVSSDAADADIAATVAGVPAYSSNGRVALPWRGSAYPKEDGWWVSVVATAASSPASITCRIIVDGRTVTDESGSDSVACDYDSTAG